MNYAELTPTSMSRYDGYMDPTMPEGEAEYIPEDVDMGSLSARGRKKMGEDTRKAIDENGEAGAAPLTDPLSDIRERAQREAKLSTRDKLMEISQTIQGKSSAADVAGDAWFVASAAKMLSYNIQKDVTTYGKNKPILDELSKPDGIIAQAQKILHEIESKRPDGQTTEDEDTTARQQAVLGQARAVARLAKEIASSYKKAEISKEYDDPFKQIVSFEELMTKFLITMDDDRFKPGGEFALLDIDQYTDEFGREISTETAHPENFLRWVEERAWFYHDFDPMKDINMFENMYIVAGARKVSMYEMTVDFNAYFAHRKVGGYGKLQVLGEDIRRAKELGKFEYFKNRREDPETGQITISNAPEDADPNDPEYDVNVIGYYKSFIDPDTGKSVRAYVQGSGELKERSNTQLLDVFYVHEIVKPDGTIEKERIPVVAVDANKENWETDNGEDTNFEYKHAQEEIMYQLWLMTMNHNYDVSYRQKGMPSEKPLSEVLAEIYSDNKFTRTRRRLLGVLDMPATTHREEELEMVTEMRDDENGKPKEVPVIDPLSKKIKYRVKPAASEAQEKFKDREQQLHHADGSRKQGSMGKAIQRSLAAWYHISEANAAFAGYSIEGKLNPFFEVLKNADGINGAEIMYSSVIKRLLLGDTKFGYKDSVEAELFTELNKTDVPRGDMTYTDKDGKTTIVNMSLTSRKRKDWEKADFIDFMTLRKGEFLAKMASRKITEGSLRTAFEELRDKYIEKTVDGKVVQKANQAKLDEISALEDRMNQNSDARRSEFLRGLQKQLKLDDAMGFNADVFKRKGEIGKDGEKLEKDGIMSAFLKPKPGEQMKGLDVLAIGLFTKAFGTEFVTDMNPYSHIRYGLEARELMRGGMRDALTFTEKLDEFEAKWAEEWAYTFTFHTGISARNDMPGIGHDAWSKILNTEWYRLRQTSGGNYPGNLDNLYGIHRLGVNFWEGLVVREDGSSKYDKTLYQELVGLEKVGDEDYRFNINKDIPGFEFAGNAQRQFYADHVNHTVELFIDITQKHEFNFDKIVKTDQLGRVTIDHAEMQKLIDSTWKHMRYGFDNNNFLYDNPLFGWWYDEGINAEGQVERKPHFGLKSMRDLMFSEEVQLMRMYERKDVKGWAGLDKNGKETEVFRTKMGRNVFAYLLKAQFEEHTKRSGTATIYTADQISLIAEALMSHVARVMKGEQGEAIVLSGFFTPEEMYRIMVFAHAILWHLYAKEYGVETFGGLLAGIFQAMSLIMKEVGAGITLKS